MATTDRYSYGPSVLGGFANQQNQPGFFDTPQMNDLQSNYSESIKNLMARLQAQTPQRTQSPNQAPQRQAPRLAGERQVSGLGSATTLNQGRGGGGLLGGGDSSPSSPSSSESGAPFGGLSRGMINGISSLGSGLARSQGIPGDVAGAGIRGVLSGNWGREAPTFAGGVARMATNSPLVGGLVRGAVNIGMDNPENGYADIGGTLGGYWGGPIGGILGAGAGSIYGGAPANVAVNNMANAGLSALLGATPAGMALGVARAFGFNPASSVLGTPGAITGQRIGGLLGGWMDNPANIAESQQRSFYGVDMAPEMDEFGGWRGGYGLSGRQGSRLGADGMSDSTSRSEAGLSGRQSDQGGDIEGNESSPDVAGMDVSQVNAVNDGGNSSWGGGRDGVGSPGRGSRGAGGADGPGGDGDGGDGGGGGGGGGGGSSRVICTHFYKAGDMSREHWLADMQWTLKHCSETTQRGYHYWAIPYVKLMRRNKLAENLMRPIALTRAKELAYKMGKSDKGSFAGKLVRLVLEPISYAIGLVVEQKDYRTLYTEGN